MFKFQIGSTCRTRGGQIAKIHCTDGSRFICLLGDGRDSANNTRIFLVYHDTGLRHRGSFPSGLDLVEQLP